MNTSPELIEQIALNIGDPGMEKVPPATILRRLNQAQIQVAQIIRPKELMALKSISWTLGEREYYIAGGVGTGFQITDFLVEVRLLWDGYTMAMRTIKDYDEHSTGNRTPSFYYLRGAYIGLGDRPPASTKTVRLDYIKKPAILTGAAAETLDMPFIYHYGIELLATSMIDTQNNQWYQKYSYELEQLKFQSYQSGDSFELIPPLA